MWTHVKKRVTTCAFSIRESTPAPCFANVAIDLAFWQLWRYIGVWFKLRRFNPFGLHRFRHLVYNIRTGVPFSNKWSLATSYGSVMVDVDIGVPSGQIMHGPVLNHFTNNGTSATRRCMCVCMCVQVWCESICCEKQHNYGGIAKWHCILLRLSYSGMYPLISVAQ